MNLKKKQIIALFVMCCTQLSAQNETLTLDSCRVLALRNNKQVRISLEEIKAAHHEQKAAFANFLPKISAEGAYLHNNRNLSLLDKEQRSSLQSIGSDIKEGTAKTFQELVTAFPEASGIIDAISKTDIETPLNAIGSSISDLLTFDTRNIYIAALSLSQPLFMGGKIIAYNKIARLVKNIAIHQHENTLQQTIIDTDQAYWQTVSLSHKQRLANSFVVLLEKLHSDVEKMKNEGVATQADLLSVNVRLNEAKIALLRAENGLKLSRMLLCQICGLPMQTPITLFDENTNDTETKNKNTTYATIEEALQNRPELKSLRLAAEIEKQKIRITRADYLPQLLLSVNYLTSNPSIGDGFKKKFRGTWNITLALKIPILNWGEGINKTAAAKAQSNISKLKLADAREKIELQVQQAIQTLNEAYKRQILAQSTIKSAEENLHNAKRGFAEGVLTSENVMEAQTAWLQAHSESIDAHIDIIMSYTYLQKATGTLKTDF